MLGDKHEENKLFMLWNGLCSRVQTTALVPPDVSVHDIINGLHDVSFRLHGKVLELFKHPFDLFICQAVPHQGPGPQEAGKCPMCLDISPIYTHSSTNTA